MESEETSWSCLSQEVEKYKQKAKAKLDQYQKEKFNILYKKHHKREHQIISASEGKKNAFSINVLRQRFHQETDKSNRMKSRVQFLKVKKDRTVQCEKIAQRSLERVMSIRSTNSEEKQHYKDELKSYCSSVNQRKRQLSEVAKCSKIRVEEERKRMLSQNSMRGREQRQNRIENEELINERKKERIIENKEKVKKGNIENEELLLKKRNREKQIMEEGKKEHLKKIDEEFRKWKRIKNCNLNESKILESQCHQIVSETHQIRHSFTLFNKILFKSRQLQCSKETEKCSQSVSLGLRSILNKSKHKEGKLFEKPSSFYLTT